MDHPSPSPGVEHNAMSVSSELRPLYRLTSNKEECTEEELNSLSNPAKQVVFSFQSKTNSAHIDQECLIHCPCKCHPPSSLPAVNKNRPSVIMAPVAREQNGSSVTHFPLRMQVNYKNMRVILYQLLGMERAFVYPVPYHRAIPCWCRS